MTDSYVKSYVYSEDDVTESLNVLNVSVSLNAMLYLLNIICYLLVIFQN